ncbi:hypothetical protein ACN47E_006803 [Coniothyrium glycines]
MASDISDAIQYRIIRIPTSSPNLSALIHRFRGTKLAALQEDPSAWVYQHAAESIHPMSVWEDRMTRKNTIFICVATTQVDLPDEEALASGEWAGFAAIRGPMSVEEYYPSADMDQQVPEKAHAETRWHVYDLYIFKAHRSCGLAPKMGAALFNTVREAASEDAAARKARVRLIVHPKSTRLVEGYRWMGFEKAGMVSLKEGLELNGMKESIPQDTNSTEELRALYETRYGMAMEKIIGGVSEGSS